MSVSMTIKRGIIVSLCIFKRIRQISLGFILIFALVGCQTIDRSVHRATGQVMVKYAKQEAIPYLFSFEDLAMVCSLSDSFTPFLLSFSRVDVSVEQINILLSMTASACAEQKAWDAEFDFLRAVHQGKASDAEFFRTLQKRQLLVAAQRAYRGYQDFVTVYGEPDAACPVLKPEDELFWLIGLLNGLSAANLDLQIESALGVPLNTSQKVAKGAKCLPDQSWWGVPKAIVAAVGVLMPINEAAQQQALADLKQAESQGITEGVRLAQVIRAQILAGQGLKPELKMLIRRHVEAKKNHPAPPSLKLLDNMATVQLLAISDRLWLESQGVLTPFGQFGSFWDDVSSVPEKVEPADVGDLLSD
jgi:hypothetical protein